ncbi:MAG TPA: GH3 auxin-responsive promoter family protein [Planctomycetota bacterium]|nr:GH3 auxin-responsive promoter family protein [Planctomycetota bacterium]
MYAMSTETLMTLLVYEGREPRFLPLAPGVLYELLPDGAPDDPARLVAPWDARPGEAYSLVVSDPYGLRRYQTDDLFLVRGLVRGLPDLAFLRRRGLAYSFTGEKLTGEQVERALAALRAELPALAAANLELALFPCFPPGAPLPRYRLALAHAGPKPPAGLDLGAVARTLDAALARENAEFAAKVASGRLLPSDAALLAHDELMARFDGRTRGAADVARRTWESQGKVLPLSRAPWKD